MFTQNQLRSYLAWAIHGRKPQRRAASSTRKGPPRDPAYLAWIREMPCIGVRGGGRGYQNGGPPFANLLPRLCLFSDHLRTVLAVKGSLRRAQQRRALDGLRAVPKQHS